VLGKIHQATAGFCFSYPRKSWGLAHATDKAKELEPYFLADDFLKRHAVPQRILALLGSMPEFSTPSGVLHEDFGVRHVLFKDDIISGVIDWDRSYEGALILDIGQAIRGWCFEGSVLSLERLQRFLAGYALERRMQLSEKDFLCRAMQFAFAERAISFALLSIQGYLDQKQRALESVEIAERLTDMQTQVINLCVSAGAR
jgi:Ser/Thr protein kinase RdoA (MazF antagonist)